MIVEFGSTRGIGRLLVTAWYLELRGAPSVRTVVTTLSVMCLVAAGLLSVVSMVSSPGPVEVPLLASGLAIQGGYTLWFLARDRPALARQLLLVGETMAMLVGLGALLAGTIDNIGAVDREYAPLAVAGLIAAHAMASLYMFAIRTDSPSVTE